METENSVIQFKNEREVEFWKDVVRLRFEEGNDPSSCIVEADQILKALQERNKTIQDQINNYNDRF